MLYSFRFREVTQVVRTISRVKHFCVHAIKTLLGESNLETEPNLADIESSVHSGDSALLESEGEMK